MIVGEARVPEGLRVYAIGDVHGCIDQLRELIAMIDRDVSESPIERHRLVFLGDYVDRGPANREVIEYLIALDESDRDCVFLRGNHDDRFLAIESGKTFLMPDFLRWGGAATLRDYGVEKWSWELDENLIHRAIVSVPNSHFRFLDRLQYCHEEGDYFFCHAGVRPGISLSDQAEHDLIWIRQDFLKHEQPFEKVIVHGHTPHNRPEVMCNRINVDTRCYDTGKLTTVVLEGNRHRFIHTNRWEEG